MKGVKILEFIIILIFTLITLFYIFYFFSNKKLKNEEKIDIFSKEDFLFKIRDYVIKCFESFNKEKKSKICYEINYFDRPTINKEDIEKRLKDLNFDTFIELDVVNYGEKVFIVYYIKEVKIIKSKSLIE